jgi:hypothetical protein
MPRTQVMLDCDITYAEQCCQPPQPLIHLVAPTSMHRREFDFRAFTNYDEAIKERRRRLDAHESHIQVMTLILDQDGNGDQVKPKTTTRMAFFELDDMPVAKLREILDRCPEDAKIKVDEDDYFSVAPGEEPIPQILFPTTEIKDGD